MCPQWEGGLELDAAGNCDNINDVMIQNIRDSISAMRECSLWILIWDSTRRECLAEREWNNDELFGEFAGLWLFLMTNNGGTPSTQLLEWPSLCFDFRNNFGFAPRTAESREWPDLHTLGCAGKWI